MPLSPSTSLGRYEILSTLGAGGMGEVYLAHDTRLNRQIALKVLPADLINNRERLHRFEQEARAASALNHPNIITIHEIGAEGDTHFIAMEFVEGETLRHKLQMTRVEIEETLNIATQIAAALDAAHRSGIVHRDLKPENVMVRKDGLVKVLDFGIAKLTQEKTKDVDSEAVTRAKTQAGMILGTVAYMSPEQARGLQVDARTDIFSLGVVVYEMLTGRLPFADETMSDMITALLTTEPAPLSDFNQEIPTELERIVSKMLAKDREERYQTAKDLLVDLRRLTKQTEIERTASVNKAQNENTTQIFAARLTSSANYIAEVIRKHKLGFIVVLSVLLLAGVGLSSRFFASRSPSGSLSPAPIESIAILPFQNESGNPDVEYLSDGMAESLINSLSQLPKLSVKARSSVFRYKGKNVEPQTIATELSVQAILNGRVVQRGDDLVLYLSLVDGRSGNQLWGEQYNRKLTDLVALQNEITRDVSRKLRARLSGADERRVARNYTQSVEAYRLYLKGRHHAGRNTPSETQRAISYYQQAIEIDPNYALAYVKLSNAYLNLALTSEIPATEIMPRAKAAANKAIEIDDTLAEAHQGLCSISYWYDWDSGAAEQHIKRALGLNPNSPDVQIEYAAFLSNTGRQTEALVEVKRAIELDPSDVFYKAMQGLMLIRARQYDEGLAVLQKIIEQSPNYWQAYLFAIPGYTEQGKFTEALALARQASELAGNNPLTMSFLGQTLAKSGNRAEARVVLEEMLKLSKERHVSPYNIAVVYNGLEDCDETFAWLERAYELREPRMAMLPMERKWDNLRSDPRFQDLLRRVGFTP